jgi:dUTP pyrophosphatase
MKVYLDRGAVMPTRAHSTDAGLDLYARRGADIPPHGSAVFDTGVHVMLPHGTYGKIESKSGLNINSDIVSCGGVIDEGYTGSIKVKLYNLGDRPFIFHMGEKIAQLIVQPCLYVHAEQTKDWGNDTDRGNNGFGSTGR